MTVFSPSDIVVFVTLSLNGMAMLSSGKNFNTVDLSLHQENDELLDPAQDDVSMSPAKPLTTKVILDNAMYPIVKYVRLACQAVRRYSCILIMWNILFFFLMIIVFGE